MYKSCSELQNEMTIEPEVFQNMDDFELPKEYSCFGMSIRLQFPKFSRGFNVSDFKSFIEEHVGPENVVALGRLAFPNEWHLQVSNKDVREKLIRIERTKINMRTCWISPLSQCEVRGHIHWLPAGIPDDDVVSQLKSYGQVLFIERQTQSKFDLHFESDSRYFGLFLRSGQTVDDIPHFMFFNSFQAFVSIRGRAPICFHCRGVGHRKNECKAFYAKLGLYCCRTPGRIQRDRPRGRRWRSNAHIEGRRVKEHVCAKPKNELDVAVPETELCVKDEDLHEFKMDIVKTLTTTEALNEKIEVAAKILCGELKNKKKKKRKSRKRSGLSK